MKKGKIYHFSLQPSSTRQVLFHWVMVATWITWCHLAQLNMKSF